MMFAFGPYGSRSFVRMAVFQLLTWLSILNYVIAERKFPDDFKFGVATASYQVEGGWNADGKGESIWDRLVHTNQSLVKDQSNGDVADDSYNNYKRDVQMLKELGVTHYRFSLSWPRILPTGFETPINEAGIQYYNNLINELLANNIQPFVTLFHWDLPQELQELGGWTNPLIAQWFENYAKIAFTNFGDRVKMWLTMNEPNTLCHEGYATMSKAPLVNSSGIGEYMCTKNLLLAHAKAYRIYDEAFRKQQGGQVGITIGVGWITPNTSNAEDVRVTQLQRQGEWEIYAHPVFSKTGDWPKEFKERVELKSKAQGYSESRLPELNTDEIKLIQGTSDFFGMNHYTGYFTYYNESRTDYGPIPSLGDDEGASIYVPSDWLTSELSWLHLMPTSMYNNLKYVSERYDYPEIYITENGWATFEGLNDTSRITYYRTTWNEMLDALAESVKLKGYMAWSLMDNFEWLEGYTVRFGLYEVDFNAPERTRTARASACVYKDLIGTKTINEDYNPVPPCM